MAGVLRTRLKELRHAWNAFTDDDPFRSVGGFGTSMGANNAQRFRTGFANERSIVSSIYTRLAIDCATVPIRHVRLDGDERYIGDMDSGLNDCLKVETNIDQGPMAFFIDVILTMCDAGHAAIVAVDTTLNPNLTGGWDVKTMRVGTVVDWKPRHVTVSLYNEAKGERQNITLEKKLVAIVYNPLYSVMNEPNSTLQRLIRTLNLLDAIGEQSASGKLDLIIQLPYVVKSEARRQQAEQRRNDIEFQLKGSKYGIAYTDGTEKITQLNRPAENNLLKQVEYLTELLYGQLGLTPEVMNGTAEEAAMLNYYNRTVGPFLEAIVQAMKRAFLTKTARSQGQSIEYFRDPFKLVPMKDLAEMADKFTRNEIVTSNEFRQFIGMKPSKDPKADQLVNSNMPQPAPAPAEAPPPDPVSNDALDNLNNQLKDLEDSLGVDANVSSG